MLASLLMVGIVWLLHAAAAGLPAIVAFLAGKRKHWGYCLSLLTLPFFALIAAQMLWPIGGMSSYLARLIILTVVVLAMQFVEVLPFMRGAPAWYHSLLLTVAVVAVIPIQLGVPSYPD